MKKILFICGKNKLRSPTAEAVFSGYPGVETRSAGVNNDAVYRVTSDDILWAEYIFVMENVHKSKLQQRFRKYIKDQKIIVLGIPDKYEYMDPVLVEDLKRRVMRYIFLPVTVQSVLF